jgi:hypothetical protein
MKLIINEKEEINDPARVQVKTSFGRLFENKRAKIELKKSANERLVFTWNNYIGIVAELISYNDKVVSKDSIPFLSFRKAISAAKLFSSSGNGWKETLKMKHGEEFNSKNIIKNIIKIASYLCYVSIPLFLILGIISSFNPTNPIIELIRTEEKSFIPFFAVLMYSFFLSELPSFIYRDELDGQRKGAYPPAYIFLILAMGIIFTIYFFWPES